MDNNVYKITVVCNDTDSISVNLTTNSPKIGEYNFVYIILDFYLEATVTVQIYSKVVDTGEYLYQDIIGSPFKVPVEFIDLSLYEGYNDFTKAGFGVTYLSDIFLMPKIVIAGEKFGLRVYPRN